MKLFCRVRMLVIVFPLIAFCADMIGRQNDLLAEDVQLSPSDGSKPVEIVRNSVGMEIAILPAGEFEMGARFGQSDANETESPKHQVRITRPFGVSRTEVSVSQFSRFTAATSFVSGAERDGRGGYGFDMMRGKVVSPGAGNTWKKPGFPQTDDHPVVLVSWNDAQAFCRWLSEKEGRKYRLPTEAEWEYACRAGSATTFTVGDAQEKLATVANVADLTAQQRFLELFRDQESQTRFANWRVIQATDNFVFTAPVGQFEPNRFGLFDMHGNVAEWCQDRFDRKYYDVSPVNDPQGPLVGHARTIRGGSWYDTASLCRSSSRFEALPNFCTCTVGFRVAFDIEK